MAYVFSFCGTSQNSLKKYIVTEDILLYARRFITRIVCPIASVIVTGGAILLILTMAYTKSNCDFSCNALGKWK